MYHTHSARASLCPLANCEPEGLTMSWCLMHDREKYFPGITPIPNYLGFLPPFCKRLHNTPTCRNTRELQRKPTKSEISLILDFKTGQPCCMYCILSQPP